MLWPALGAGAAAIALALAAAWRNGTDAPARAAAHRRRAPDPAPPVRIGAQAPAGEQNRRSRCARPSRSRAGADVLLRRNLAAAPTPVEPTAVATASPLAAAEATAAVVAAAETPAVPAPSPQASPAIDAAAFWNKVDSSDNRVGALTATDELLAAWNTEPLNQEERKKSSVDLWAIAGRRGLRYLPMSGNLTRLQMLNLPAILEIAVPDSQRRRFALLTGVEDGRVLLRYDGAAVTLSNDEISVGPRARDVALVEHQVEHVQHHAGAAPPARRPGAGRTSRRLP